MNDRLPTPRDMKEWLPYHHIDRACELLELAEDGDDMYIVALAQAHAAMAEAKMIGRLRA